MQLSTTHHTQHTTMPLIGSSFGDTLGSDSFRTLASTYLPSGIKTELKSSRLLPIKIPLPPLQEQRRIAGTLRAVDEAIQANEEVITRTRELKMRLANDLLVRGLPGRHTRTKDSRIGTIPESWDVRSLGELLCRIDSGSSPKCQDRPASSNEWGVLKVSAVTGDAFLPDENKALSCAPPSLKSIEVRAGDVLLARGNGSAALVARPVYVEVSRPRLLLSDLTYRLVPRPTVLLARFLAQVLTIPSVRKQIDVRLRGTSGIHKISKSALLELKVPVPPVEEQASLSEALRAIDDYLTYARDLAILLAATRANLISSLLSKGWRAG